MMLELTSPGKTVGTLAAREWFSSSVDKNMTLQVTE